MKETIFKERKKERKREGPGGIEKVLISHC